MPTLSANWLEKFRTVEQSVWSADGSKTAAFTIVLPFGIAGFGCPIFGFALCLANEGRVPAKRHTGGDACTLHGLAPARILEVAAR